MLLEASLSNHPADIKVIASWLDTGMLQAGYFDDWDAILHSYISDEIYDESQLWAIVDEWNICIRFIEQILGTSHGKIIPDEDAEHVIGQPRS